MCYRITLILLILIGISTQRSMANHAMAVDLSYSCINDTSYQVQLAFYFDCGSSIITSPPQSPTINIQTTVCSDFMQIELERVSPGFGEEVSQLCEDYLMNGLSNCDSGEEPGVKRYVYTGVAVLKEKCSDWTFSYQLEENEFRSDNITNLAASEIEKIYVEATLNNEITCNNSPSFTTQPVAYFCSQGSVLNQGVIEADGDSLVYSLVTPLSGGGVEVDYEDGFSATSPLDANVFYFDEQTGQIEFQPNQSQISVVGLLVEEYRNGVLIGSVRRDMQLVVLDCTNKFLNVRMTASSVDGDQLDPQNNYNLCVGEEISFTLEITDANVDDVVTIISNASDISGADFTINRIADNTLEVTFMWTPSTDQAGWHVLEAKVSDNACAISSILNYTFQFFVTGDPNVGPDRAFCEGGNEIIMEATGGNTFDWSPTAGIEFIEQDGSLVRILAEGTYTVTNECGFQDEVVITNTTAFDLEVPSTVEYCRGESFQVEAITSPAGNYQYFWEPSTGVSDPTIANPTITSTGTNTYQVTAISETTGCSITRSVMVSESEEQSGLAMISPNVPEITLCKGASFELESTFEIQNSLACGYSSNDCLNPETFTIGARIDSSASEGPFNLTKPFARMQIIFQANELRDIGMSAGAIESIALTTTRKWTESPIDEFVVNIGCVSNSSLSRFEGGLQTVLETSNYSTQLGVNTLTFDRAYDWDGVSNLIIEFCVTMETEEFLDEVAVTPTNFNSVYFAKSSNTSNASGCTIGTGSTAVMRPDVQFSYCRPDVLTIPEATWSPAEGLSTTTGEQVIASPTETTTYMVTYGDGCTTPASITLRIIDYDVRAEPDTSMCEAGVVQLRVSGDYPADATFLWEPATGLSDPTIANPIATVSEDISYIVSVMTADANCLDQLKDTVDINIGGLGTATVTPDTLLCGIVAGVSIQAGGGDTYQWSPSASLSCDDCPNPLASPNETTTYSVTVSQGNCNEVLMTTLHVGLIPSISVPETITAEAGDEISLTATGNFEMLEWTDEAGNLLSGTTPMITASETTTYTATAINAGGCTSSAMLTIVVDNNVCGDLVIPTAFSPNNDGLNDYFLPHDDGQHRLTSFQVYNRWGELVYDWETDGTNGWDGTMKGEIQPFGTYVYFGKVICEEEESLLKGRIVLMR